ncbi:SRPBCC family protein [uncultured Chitinophaga sp.]|uniref:SRPBCC family protein n=1 Tax=uncultured Chitinophaga sp. TaxID=339340 RepID=UPI0025D3A0C8|nr:SRPBCC family protein [uncultured Chitinophaga sp.]
MRGIRMLLLSATVLIVLLFLFSLFFSSNAKMQRAGVIDAPASVVFRQLSDTTHWKKWYPWPVSQDLAHGKLVLGEMIKDSAVHYRVLAEDDRLSLTGSFFLTATTDGKSTTLNWSMERHVGLLPWWKVRGLLMDRVYGPTMEKGLTDLKAVAENAAGDTP